MPYTAIDTEHLLRSLAPQVLGVLLRRHGDFTAAEDAVQEAMVAATRQWPLSGQPDNPLGWLIRVANRRVIDERRGDEARRRRELLASSWSLPDPEPLPAHDDALLLLFLCCHPVLLPASAIPLTLRAVGGLTTREIAAAFLVPEPTMAQRISRAKTKVKAAGSRFRMPAEEEMHERVASVLRVLYLLFNEGYATSAGPDLHRTDLSGEAIRLSRALVAWLPDDPEVAGLLALMLLTDARRAARTTESGALVALAEQDRQRWDRSLIAEGSAVLNEALSRRSVGEYQLQAMVTSVHSRTATHGDTDWTEIAALYELLERLTGNPMVTLNRAVAVAMAEGPHAGLALLEPLAARLGSHHRWVAARAHLLQLAGDEAGAAETFAQAAAGATNLREQEHMLQLAASARGAGAAHDDAVVETGHS